MSVPEWNDNPDWTEVETKPLDVSGMLRVTRAVLGLSQAQAAAMLDMPVEALNDWEERRTEPDPAARTLIRLLFHHPREMLSLLAQETAPTGQR